MKVKRFLITTVLLIVSIVGPFQQATAEDDVDIVGDELEFIAPQNMYIGRGNVVIVRGQVTLKADEIQLNKETGESIAVGNVYYEDSEMLLKANRAEVNVKTRLGTVYDADITYKKSIKGVNYYSKSNKLERVQEKVFHLEDASLTTCKTSEGCEPAWSVKGSDVKITLGENLQVKHGTFRVKDWPILWVPYIYFPFQRDREAGLLMPKVGGGEKRGFTYEQGVFYPFDDYTDVSVYSDVFAKRGWGKGVDFRYNLSPKSRGEIWAYHINDTELEKDYVEVKSYQNQELPWGMDSYLKVHTVNHEDYYEEYDSRSKARFGVKDPYYSIWPLTRKDERLMKYLESTAHVTKPFDGGRAYVIGQYRRSLEGTSDYITHPAPEIGLVHYTDSFSPSSMFSYNLESMASNFWSDLGTRGKRLDISPTLYMNLGRTVAFSQSIGVRETIYRMTDPGYVVKLPNTDPQKLPKGQVPANLLDTKYAEEQPEDFSRTLLEATSSLSSKFYKQHGSLTHLVEPIVQFEYINSAHELDAPNFDLVDIRPETRTFTYELRNMLQGRGFTGWFRVQHGFTLLDEEKTGGNSWPVTVETTFSSDPVTFDLHTLYNTEENQIDETQVQATYWWDEKRNNITAGRIYRRDNELDQYNFGLNSSGLMLDLPVDLNSLMWVNVNGQGVQRADVILTYHRQCWAPQLQYEYREDGYRILFGVELKGAGFVSLGDLYQDEFDPTDR